MPFTRYPRDVNDSGVGRHQHVIVSQGQIDAVLNAKPEDRRSIIEKRWCSKVEKKRKSERRLRSTEENITRLQDLLREVKRQLKPLNVKQTQKTARVVI